MALINCPECQKEISDKVKSCPSCGYPLIEESAEIQKVEITSLNLKKMERGKKKKIVIAIVSLIIAIIALVIGYIAYGNNQEKSAEKEYAKNMNLVIDNILSSGERAEELLNLTEDIWNNAINKESDVVTNKYTQDKFGSFVGDFNTALTKFFSYSGTTGTISQIKAGQLEVSKTMGTLKIPPESYKRSYDALLELYSAYQGMVDLAINPNGTLVSFKNSKKEKIEKFVELYKKLEAIKPNIK